MKTAHKVIIGYFAIGVIYALYYWIWGDADHSKGFFVNLIVTTLLWPAVMFPIIGKIIGAIVIVGVIATVMAS